METIVSRQMHWNFSSLFKEAPLACRGQLVHTCEDLALSVTCKLLKYSLILAKGARIIWFTIRSRNKLLLDSLAFSYFEGFLQAPLLGDWKSKLS